MWWWLQNWTLCDLICFCHIKSTLGASAFWFFYQTEYFKIINQVVDTKIILEFFSFFLNFFVLSIQNLSVLIFILFLPFKIRNYIFKSKHKSSIIICLHMSFSYTHGSFHAFHVSVPAFCHQILNCPSSVGFVTLCVIKSCSQKCRFNYI